MSAAAAAYQARVTGANAGTAYVANTVKFDGFANGVLIEAKAEGYAKFVKDNEFREWFRGKRGFVKQAKRQVAAAKGTPIEWRFAEELPANVTRALFDDEQIFEIDIVHVP